MSNKIKTFLQNGGWIFLVAVIVSLFASAFYFVKFSYWSFSGKSEDWGQFGAYIGGVLTPLLSLIVLWTIIKTLRLNSEAVNYSSQAIEESKQDRIKEENRIKRQNTFDFSLTFQTQDMMESRLIASKMLKANKGKTYNLKKMQMSKEDDYIHLAKVLNSFRQLNVLKNNEIIDENLSKELFGSYYVHFKEFFDEILKDNDPGSNGMLAQIKKLQDWMPQNYFD